jgi:8-oxo-dGTP diphosphatase
MPKSENKPRIIRKIGLAEFKDKKVLLGRDNKNNEVFIMIGGKVEEGESDIECLNREVREELEVGLDQSSIKFLHEFNGPAHGHDKKMVVLNIRVYEANFVGEPQTTEEIVEINYFDSTVDPKHLSEIGRTQIFPWLKSNGYIN